MKVGSRVMPLPFERGGAQHIAVVGAQRGSDGHTDQLVVLHQLPALQRAGVAIVKAAVLRQIGRHLRRAMAGDVLRRRRQHAPGRHQAAARSGWNRERADAHRDVDALLERIDEAVVEGQLDGEVG
jgi:hypothetical protein